MKKKKMDTKVLSVYVCRCHIMRNNSQHVTGTACPDARGATSLEHLALGT